MAPRPGKRWPSRRRSGKTVSAIAGAVGEVHGVLASDPATLENCYARYPETRRWYCRAHQPNVDYLAQANGAERFAALLAEARLRSRANAVAKPQGSPRTAFPVPG
jgi:hypothetical protein